MAVYSFRVRNYEKFQHYKDRSPVWIKLYNDLLDNYDYARLPDASKAHLLAIWLLASRSENKLPADPKWIAGRIGATEPVNLEALFEAGFLEWCDGERPTIPTATDARSNPLAEPYQSATPEKEEEEETEKRRISLSADADRERGDAEFERLWQQWQWHKTPKGSKKAALDEWNRHVRKPGLDANAVIAASLAYCAQCRRTDTSTQHIERWLKKHRWEDDYGGVSLFGKTGNGPAPETPRWHYGLDPDTIARREGILCGCNTVEQIDRWEGKWTEEAEQRRAKAS